MWGWFARIVRLAGSLFAPVRSPHGSARNDGSPSPIDTKQAFGNEGERMAQRFLESLGFRILDKQFRCRFGEVDLIALDGDTIVFVEVKTRQSDRKGQPAEAVTPHKQQQIVKVALHYLKRHGWLDRRSRCDVVAIRLDDPASPHITHYRHAFEPPDPGQMFS